MQVSERGEGNDGGREGERERERERERKRKICTTTLKYTLYKPQNKPNLITAPNNTESLYKFTKKVIEGLILE